MSLLQKVDHLKNKQQTTTKLNKVKYLEIFGLYWNYLVNI
jgi:hypothetical protein